VPNRSQVASSPAWTPGLKRALFIMVQMRRKLGIKARLKLWNLITGLNMIETPRAPHVT
jgi:hypothetical protein